MGDKDNTAHPTLPTCPPGPPAPQHTGAPLGVVAASPLRTHDLGGTQPCLPRAAPCSQSTPIPAPWHPRPGLQKATSQGDCSVPGGCPEPAWACEQSPGPSAGLPSQPPRICATSWHPPAPKGRKGGLSASFPSTATSSSLSFWHLPFSFPIPSHSPPRPPSTSPAPPRPPSALRAQPERWKRGARAGRGARSPLPASPHLRAPAGKRAPHRTAPPRRGLRCPSEPGGESRGGSPRHPPVSGPSGEGGSRPGGVRTCAGAARLASAGRAAHSRPRAAG